jgi:hypothetical protein
VGFLGIRERAVDIEQQGFQRGYCQFIVIHNQGI